MADRLRILIFEPPGQKGAEPWDHAADLDLVRVDDVNRGLELLRSEQFDAVCANTRDPALWQRASSLVQADALLQALGDGVAVVDQNLRIVWANDTFQKMVRRAGQRAWFLRSPGLAGYSWPRLLSLPHRSGRPNRSDPSPPG